MQCRLTLRLQFLRRWEAFKSSLAPYIGPPLVRCAGAWQAIRPSTASQQASERPVHLAETPVVDGQSEAPDICLNYNQEEASYGLVLPGDYAHLDGQQQLELPEMGQYSEHDLRLLQGLECHSQHAWETDMGEGGIEHVSTEADATAEQTESWKHAKAE